MSKGKERRDRIKAETEALNARRQLINDADSMADLLADIPMFKRFSKNDLTCEIQSYNTFTPEQKDWIFGLTSRQMRPFYEKTWGWSDKNKRQELFGEKARYLIATCDGRPIAFVNFQFDVVTGSPLVYVYELHVEDEYQRKGLGKFLTQAVEFIALKRKMEAVMATIFLESVPSTGLFTNLKYRIHPSSPEISDPESGPDYQYQVLFKPLVKA